MNAHVRAGRARVGCQAIEAVDEDAAADQEKPSEDALLERCDDLADVATSCASFLKTTQLLERPPMLVPVAAELLNATMLAVLGEISAKGGSLATQADAMNCLGSQARPDLSLFSLFACSVNAFCCTFGMMSCDHSVQSQGAFRTMVR